MSPAPLSWCKVTVIYRGAAYHATARGITGARIWKASSTNCALVAAQAAAHKWLGAVVSPGQITLVREGSASGGAETPWIYLAGNRGPIVVSAEIEWHFQPELPDDETTVLMANGDSVYEGAHFGDHWESSAGAFFGETDVYAWAHLPSPPELPGRPVKNGGAA